MEIKLRDCQLQQQRPVYGKLWEYSYTPTDSATQSIFTYSNIVPVCFQQLSNSILSPFLSTNKFWCWQFQNTCKGAGYGGQEHLLTANGNTCLWMLHLLDDLLHLKVEKRQLVNSLQSTRILQHMTKPENWISKLLNLKPQILFWWQRSNVPHLVY